MFVETKEAGEAHRVCGASQLLLDAAELIDRHGHAKGAHVDDCGRMCVLGALGFRLYKFPSAEMTSAVARMENFISQTIPHWNDDPGRTKEEVVATLRAVAMAA